MITAEPAHCMTYFQYLSCIDSVNTRQTGVLSAQSQSLTSWLLHAVLLSIFSNPLIQPASARGKKSNESHVKQLEPSSRLQWTLHHSSWGCSICRAFFSLWRHLLVDVDNADKEQEDHHQVVQDPQQSAEGGVRFKGISWWRDRVQRRGGYGHHGPNTAQGHPEEKQPHQSSHGA